MIDPRFLVPEVPIDVALTARDNAVATWLIAICSVLAIIGLLYALHVWKRTGSPLAVLLIVGGAVTNLAEPFVDIGGACWHPVIGQHTIFTLLSRPMPLWLLFAYIAYFGVLMMLLYTSFSRGATTRTMWLWFLIPVIADIVLEESLMGFSDHLYVYYGNQPLRLHVFPMWWPAPNTMGIYLSGVVMTLFAPLLRGWRAAFALVSTPLCYLAATGLVALPSVFVINADYPNWITQLGGIGTYLIAFLVVHGCTRLIATDTPYRIFVRPKATAEAA